MFYDLYKSLSILDPEIYTSTCAECWVTENPTVDPNPGIEIDKTHYNQSAASTVIVHL